MQSEYTAIILYQEHEIKQLRDEIERLRGVCKDKTELLVAAYEQNERLRALHQEAYVVIERLRSEIATLTTRFGEK